MRVGTGTVVQCIDAAVCMPQLLDVVSTCRQACDGDLATAVCGIRTSNQRGTGAVAVDAEAPVGKVLSVFRGLGLIEVAQIGRIESEVGIEIAIGGAGQRDGSLVGRTRHVPDVISGICSRGYILGSFENRRLGNGSSLVDVQIVAALIELSTITIGETPFREDSITVIDRGFISGEGDVRCIGAGTAGEAGSLHCALNIRHQSIIIGRKVGNCSSTGIVEDVTSCAALIGRVQCKGCWITQTADDLIDQELGCYTERDVGIGIPFYIKDTDGIVPHLIAIQQDQTDGFPSCGR